MSKFIGEIEGRFWALVDREGGVDSCWNWRGPVQADQYGIFNLGVRRELAHRVAFELSGTDIPAGFIVMHTCGNRLCCNPSHLRVGTRAEQMAARSRLRRLPRPESAGDS